jgi:peptidoglycan/LPS O-acetylase OafA/YrhL
LPSNVPTLQPARLEASRLQTSSRHVPALDGVRGLAILLVLLHTFNRSGPTDVFLNKVVDLGMDIGWVGVQLFFVLSGFLITGILVDTKKAPNYFRSFYGRRVLRIFPLYYLVLTAYFVVAPRVVELPASVLLANQEQAWLWAYLSNWIVIRSPAFSHFWSLAVEEQFYLVWPLVVAASSGRTLRRVCLGLSVAALALRMALVLAGASQPLIYQCTLTRMDALAIGAATALLVRDPSRLRAWRPHLRPAMLGIGLFLLVLTVATRGLPLSSSWTETVGFTALALLGGGLVAQIAVDTAEGRHTWVSNLFTMRLLRTLGKYSYGMYVFGKMLHVWALKTLAPWLVPVAGLRRLPLLAGYVLAAIVVTFAAAFLSYHLVEDHFLRLKKWFAPEVPLETSGLSGASATA